MIFTIYVRILPPSPPCIELSLSHLPNVPLNQCLSSGFRIAGDVLKGSLSMRYPVLSSICSPRLHCIYIQTTQIYIQLQWGLNAKFGEGRDFYLNSLSWYISISIYQCLCITHMKRLLYVYALFTISESTIIRQSTSTLDSHYYKLWYNNILLITRVSEYPFLYQMVWIYTGYIDNLDISILFPDNSIFIMRVYCSSDMDSMWFFCCVIFLKVYIITYFS